MEGGGLPWWPLSWEQPKLQKSTNLSLGLLVRLSRFVTVLFNALFMPPQWRELQALCFQFVRLSLRVFLCLPSLWISANRYYSVCTLFNTATFVLTEISLTTTRWCFCRAEALDSSVLFLWTWLALRRTGVPITWWLERGRQKQQKKRRNMEKSTSSTQSWTLTQVSLCVLEGKYRMRIERLWEEYISPLRRSP